ncbi:MAG: gamma-glutamyltransferase [Planctomycetota bacterium]
MKTNDKNPEVSRTAGKGMVVAAEAEAARVGTDLLNAGGNAIDAAVGVGFALAVTYPAAGNLGGGGFLVGSVGREKSRVDSVALDFREVAPQAATESMYTEAHDQGKEEASLTGHLAAGVPGSVDGMLHALDRWGSLSREQVLAPAIRLAREGFAMTERTHRMLNSSRTRDRMLRYRASADLFYPEGTAFPPGKIFRQPELANTLELIAKNGRAGFYEGEVADHLVTEMKRGGGIIRPIDLKTYRCVERDPIRFKTESGSAITMPPPSSGGVCLAQISRMMENARIQVSEAGSSRHLHWMAESMRRSFADRNTWLGDPDFVDCYLERLLDPEYLSEKAASIQPEEATPSTSLVSEETLPKESEQTTHYSVVDKHGNGVAVTTTLNGSFGSKVLVPGAGFLLNNEMDDFTARPGVPNLFGLVQGKPNAIAPGKRPLSSMSPTVCLSDGTDNAEEVLAVLGTPGGPTIITNVFQVLYALDHLKLSPELAVTMPKMHHQCFPDRLDVEKSVPQSTLGLLKVMNHTIGTRSSIGDFQLISRMYRSEWVGISDPRGAGSVSAQ